MISYCLVSRNTAYTAESAGLPSTLCKRFYLISICLKMSLIQSYLLCVRVLKVWVKCLPSGEQISLLCLTLLFVFRIKLEHKRRQKRDCRVSKLGVQAYLNTKTHPWSHAIPRGKTMRWIRKRGKNLCSPFSLIFSNVYFVQLARKVSKKEKNRWEKKNMWRLSIKVEMR